MKFVGALALMFCSITAAAGPIDGPAMASGELGPGIGFSYTYELKAKENTTFHVIVKEGEGDVDCDLLDSDGNLLSRQTKGHDCNIRYQPQKRAKYVFLVRNENVVKRAKFVAIIQ